MDVEFQKDKEKKQYAREEMTEIGEKLDFRCRGSTKVLCISVSLDFNPVFAFEQALFTFYIYRHSLALFPLYIVFRFLRPRMIYTPYEGEGSIPEAAGAGYERCRTAVVEEGRCEEGEEA